MLRLWLSPFRLVLGYSGFALALFSELTCSRICGPNANSDKYLQYFRCCFASVTRFKVSSNAGFPVGKCYARNGNRVECDNATHIRHRRFSQRTDGRLLSSHSLVATDRSAADLSRPFVTLFTHFSMTLSGFSLQRFFVCCKQVATWISLFRIHLCA